MVECGLDTFDSVQSLLTMVDGSLWVVENAWVLPEGFLKDNDGRIDILCEATYIRSTSQYRELEIITPGMTLTPTAISSTTATVPPAVSASTRSMTLCTQSDIKRPTRSPPKTG